MYGGLFGDLPEAKKLSQKNEEPEEKPANATSSFAANPLTTADDATTMTTEASKPHQKQPPLQSSIVKSVGKSGTAVAFVPTAALKPRKRPPPTSTVRNSFPAGAKSIKAIAPNEEKLIDSQMSHQNAALFEDSQITAATADASSRQISAIDTPHDPPLEEASSPQRPQGLSSRFTEEQRQQLKQQAMDDPYDPMVPNDLLQYWEHKAMADERAFLERQRMEQVQQQQDLRRQLDIERRHLEQQGNVEMLLEHERQRGRGRGVSNLPAWMTARQQHENNVGNTQK